MSTRKELFAKAKAAGVKVNANWTNERLEKEIADARSGSRDNLVQKATGFGMVVPDEWSDEQVAEAIQAYEEARDSSTEPLAPSRPQRRRFSPRG